MVLSIRCSLPKETGERWLLSRRNPHRPTADSAADIDRAVADTFAQSFFGALPEPGRSSARAEVADLVRPVLMDETGTWIADYVRLRFRATLLA